MLHNSTPTDRKLTLLRDVFAGRTDVTSSDIRKLAANSIVTAADFAKAANDGDLTDNGMSAEESIRLIAAFEASSFSDLLNYLPTPAAPVSASPTPAAPAATPLATTDTRSTLRRWWDKLVN